MNPNYVTNAQHIVKKHKTYFLIKNSKYLLQRLHVFLHWSLAHCWYVGFVQESWGYLEQLGSLSTHGVAVVRACEPVGGITKIYTCNIQETNENCGKKPRKVCYSKCSAFCIILKSLGYLSYCSQGIYSNTMYLSVMSYMLKVLSKQHTLSMHIQSQQNINLFSAIGKNKGFCCNKHVVWSLTYTVSRFGQAILSYGSYFQ